MWALGSTERPLKVVYLSAKLLVAVNPVVPELSAGNLEKRLVADWLRERRAAAFTHRPEERCMVQS